MAKIIKIEILNCAFNESDQNDKRPIIPWI